MVSLIKNLCRFNFTAGLQKLLQRSTKTNLAETESSSRISTVLSSSSALSSDQANDVQRLQHEFQVVSSAGRRALGLDKNVISHRKPIIIPIDGNFGLLGEIKATKLSLWNCGEETAV